MARHGRSFPMRRTFRTPPKTNTVFTQSFTAALGFTGSRSTLVRKSLSGGLSWTGTLNRLTSHKMTAGLSFTGSLVKRLARSLNGGLSFTGAFAKGSLFSKAFTGGLSYVGSLSKTTRKSLSGGLSYTGAIRKQTNKRLTGGVSFTGNVGKLTRKAFNAGVSFVGNITSLLNPTTGTTYYVSATGNDALAGTSTGTAWQTIAKVNATALVPGDKVYFKGGDSFSGTINANYSGSSGHPITYGSYGTGQATITPTTSYGLAATNRNYLTVENLTFTGNSTVKAGGIAGLTFYGVTSTSSGNLIINNCTISEFTYGISLGTEAATSQISNVTISNSTVHDCRNYGILTYGQDAFTGSNYCLSAITVSGCTIYNIKGDSTNTSAHTGDGIDFGRVDGGTIENCVAHNNGELNACTTEGPVGIMAYYSQNVTIQSCLSYNNKSGTAIDGDGIDLDLSAKNCTVQYCFSYNNDGAGILSWGASSGNVIRFNVCWGNGKNTLGTPFGEIAVGGSGSYGGIDVYHNTLISRDFTTSAPTVWVTGTPSGVTFRNNILYAASGNNIYAASNYTTAQVLFQGNDYYSSTGERFLWNGTTYTTLSAWRSALSGQETVSGQASGLTFDPGLHAATAQPTLTTTAELTAQTDYQLQDTSTLISQGLNLSSLFSTNIGTRDYLNNLVGTVYDIGAIFSHSITPPQFVYAVVRVAGAVKSFLTSGAKRTATDNAQNNIATANGGDTIRDIDGQSNQATIEGQTNTTELDN